MFRLVRDGLSLVVISGFVLMVCQFAQLAG
jgi:hypothetical protein